MRQYKPLVIARKPTANERSMVTRPAYIVFKVPKERSNSRHTETLYREYYGPPIYVKKNKKSKGAGGGWRGPGGGGGGGSLPDSVCVCLVLALDYLD